MYSTKALEFNLILSLIQAYAFSKAAGDEIIETQPLSHYDTVVLNLTKSNELKSIIQSYGKLPFVKDFDIYKIVSNLEKLNFLKVEDFLRIRRYIRMEISLENYFKTIDVVYIKT